MLVQQRNGYVELISLVVVLRQVMVKARKIHSDVLVPLATPATSVLTPPHLISKCIICSSTPTISRAGMDYL